MDIIRNISLPAILLAGAFTFSALADDAPKILTVQPLYGGGLSNMSANGAWAVGDAVNTGNSSLSSYPRIVNTATGETTELFSAAEGLQAMPMGATCVSNDGKTVGGSYCGYPAVWKEGKGWTSVDSPRGYDGGLISAITPDGKYGVGRVSIGLFHELPCMWDLETLKMMELPGMINSNPRYTDLIEAGEDPANWPDSDLNVRLTGISPDANVLLGTVDFAYPAATWEFIYRRDTGSWTPLGMKYDRGRLSSLEPEILNVGECYLSPDGKYIGGQYYSISDTSKPFSTLTDSPESYTLHPDGDGLGVWAIGSDGVLYGAAPYATPIRNWSAKVGKYWYDWKMVLKQLYGVDWMDDVTKDDMGLSGTVNAVSADSKTILSTDWTNGTSYIITLPAPLSEICAYVDLLGNYSVFPPVGAEFSMLQSIVLDMGREVEVCGEKTDASLIDSEGNRVRASINISIQPDNKRCVEVIFRNYTLEPGKSYSVVIPAGTIQVAGDPERVNKEITVTYKGRPDSPVKPVNIYPETGSSVPRINFTTNPVTVTFDAAVNPGENVSIGLYQIKDGQEEFLFPLNAALNDRRMLIYPVSEQRLADGCDYRIEVGEGAVTDLSGAGANETFSILYHGSYVPEIDPSSNTIFRDVFANGVAGMLLFDGDGNTPGAEMDGWGFQAENTPWVPVIDENDATGSYSAASHSSYDPAGKSDDWMVTPQLFIPDDKASLSFKSQSYKFNKKDMLKVFVWESDEIVTILTQNIVEKIRYQGEMVYNKLQSPGQSEETLAGDWMENRIDLSKYAGKYIYIAFLNDNQNQSAVFVDDVIVSREVAAIISIDTERNVVDADNVVIKGRFVAMKETGLDGYSLVLRDSNDHELGRIVSDEELEQGEMCAFVFPDAVAIGKGDSEVFTIEFVSGPESIVMKHELRNLLFQTTKRVALEEKTGTTCQFCPQGILATEYLHELYGDLFIPVAIHSYTGDTFGGAEHSAYSSFLGLSGAPTAVIARGSDIASPMYYANGDYNFTSPDGLTWLQKMEEALAEMTIADLDVKNAEIDEASRKITVDMSVKFAVNLPACNVNVFGVIMEDNIFGIQTNGLSGTAAPGLGEWGKDGKYGQSMVIWYYDDVVRGTSAIETAGVYSGFNGKGGYLPASVEAGREYDVKFDFNLPYGIADLSKTKVCVILIDANTGEYINAGVIASDPAAVEGVEGGESAVADVFDLSGRVVMRAASIADIRSLDKGIYIHAGKKYIVR